MVRLLDPLTVNVCVRLCLSDRQTRARRVTAERWGRLAQGFVLRLTRVAKENTAHGLRITCFVLIHSSPHPSARSDPSIYLLIHSPHVLSYCYSVSSLSLPFYVSLFIPLSLSPLFLGLPPALSTSLSLSVTKLQSLSGSPPLSRSLSLSLSLSRNKLQSLSGSLHLSLSLSLLLSHRAFLGRSPCEVRELFRAD